ncbi:sigma-70 family RNA polymerase sigma factor [Lysinibacillus fusiformis]|uniref:sigma-70 family RNA polymerase sigma factor n=1 Tax=Lysinibacillus fusiformis TaxID=28031 RepID=UPI0019681573|nr:sigma-70 family RNA polymerase sigma factor [Lysinibacillus fusiformis]QSB11432.1 sigma-70 family RNA polymerase sigma factor [Lysinibacillus fusiformis]
MTPNEKEKLLYEVMNQHGDYLKRLIYTYVKEPQKTEDLVQEVFIKFYKSIDVFGGRSSAKTYLYRIAVNECKNYLKSWHYKKVEVTEKMKNWLKRDSLELDILQQEQNQSIGQLVNSLPTKYREVIWLHYYVELSIAEMAEVLKCSPNTVKTRLARGRKLAKITIEEGDLEYEY